jgi:glutathione synthase/RimK-type ligase-like ATP-grasp enzyme|tara:strand:- start:31 stop:1017 length:987 start_codon:yes stop_codon:yes gene_type:complete
MIYLHKDSIYENQTIGSWAIPIFKYLRKKGKQVKLIDAHDLEVVNNLKPNEDDLFFGRFGHDAADKKMSKKTLPIVWKKFKNTFPSAESYYHYDDKLKQYNFMTENNIPCLETFYVKSKKDIDIEFPIVMKKTWGAGSEQVNYFETIDDVIDNKKNRGWTLQSIYPSLIQRYQDVDFDYRVLLYNSGFIIYKRLNEWKTKNKDNFPYGTEWRDRKDVLEKRKSLIHGPSLADAFDDLNDALMTLIKKLKDIQINKLNSYYMSWDIIKTNDGYKVLEFSAISTMFNPFSKFYSFSDNTIIKENTRSVLAPIHRYKEFDGIKKLIDEYIK